VPDLRSGGTPQFNPCSQTSCDVMFVQLEVTRHGQHGLENATCTQTELSRVHSVEPNRTDLHQVDPVTRRVIGHARQRHEVDWLQFPAYSSQTAVQFTSCAVKQAFNRERKCVDTIGTVLIPWAGRRPFPMLQHKYIFQVKYTEAILSNCTRKLLWFEITEMLIAFKKINLLCYLP